MIIETKEKNKITVSFSPNVGATGIKRIKNYIEFLEMGSTSKKNVSQKEISSIAKDISTAAWLKMRKKKAA